MCAARSPLFSRPRDRGAIELNAQDAMETNIGAEALLPLLVVVMFVQAAVCGVLAQIIADSKGQPRVRWFWIGFCLSVVGVIWAGNLADLKEQ